MEGSHRLGMLNQDGGRRSRRRKIGRVASIGKIIQGDFESKCEGEFSPDIKEEGMNW
jgi:hypothetical protein